MIGTTLTHYRITAKLGEGGMGAVYAAEDTKLGRRVALKVLPAELAGDAERIGRFQREARAVAALNHPNIVVLYSVEESAGTHFLTMELVDGEPLSDLIPAGGLSLDRILEYGIALADAVSAAHDHGIIHRDLKPANVMVSRAGRIKVLDFGLAKLADVEPSADDVTQIAQASLTAEGRIVGTVAHMAPEQAEGKTVDARTDIFALGTILYQMATGERPFVGDSALSILSAILKDTPPPVTEVRPELPRHLARIVARCLEKDPERRYQSAKDLRNELAGLQHEIASGRDTSEGRTSEPADVSRAPSGPSGPNERHSSGSGSGVDRTASAPAPFLRRRGVLLGLGVAALAALATAYLGRWPAPPAPPTLYTLATADSTTGTYFPLGRRLGQLLEENLQGVAVRVVPSSGSFDNAEMLDRGEAQLAFMQSDVAFHSVRTDRVLGHRSEDIVGLAVLFQEYAQILVRNDAGVTTLADLPGKRVSLGLLGSGSHFSSQILIDQFGIELDPAQVTNTGTPDSNLRLVADELDASFQWYAAPHQDLVDVLHTGKVSLLPISPALARGLQASNPFMLPGQIPAGTYPHQTEPVDTVVVKALLVGRRSLPDDFVTGVLDVLFANVPELIAAHPRAAEISAETAFRLEDGMSIPLHPAAAAWRR